MKTTVIFSLLGLCLGGLCAWLLSVSQDQPTFSFAHTVRTAAPSVVNIYTLNATMDDMKPSTKNNNRHNTYQQKKRIEQHRELSLGSGIIMDDSGVILTNYHVIKDAKHILTLLYNGGSAAATVVGVDPDTDLAVLRIQAPNLTPMRLGNLQQVHVGDLVLAIGNPYGFGHTVSSGIISALGRNGLHLNTYEHFIQTDAVITMGSSGGALVTQTGELIGINSAAFTEYGGYQGIGLAIPINIAVKVMQDILDHGQVIRGWLGFDAAEINPLLASEQRLPFNHGIMVTWVHPNGPAAKVNILPGDIIIEINGMKIINGYESMLSVANLSPHSNIRIMLLRNGERIAKQIRVGLRPQ